MRELRQLALQNTEDGVFIDDELIEYIDILQVIVKPSRNKPESQSEFHFRYVIPGKMHVLGHSYSNVKSVEVGPVNLETTRNLIDVLRKHHVSVAEMKTSTRKVQK